MSDCDHQVLSDTHVGCPDLFPGFAFPGVAADVCLEADVIKDGLVCLTTTLFGC